jgi:hypothetical protein
MMGLSEDVSRRRRRYETDLAKPNGCEVAVSLLTHWYRMQWW